MTLDILTAASTNGIITPARGISSMGLIETLAIPQTVLERHRELRRRYDALLVGPNTVLIDDPMLTSHAVPGYTCVRATIDPAGKIPRHYRIFDGSVRTIIGISSATPRAYRDFLDERGIESIACGESKVNLAAFLSALAERGLARVVVEGGGRLNRALLDQDLVERIHLILMPIVLDSSAVNLFDGISGSLGRLRLESCERLEDYLLLHYAVVKEA